MNPNTIFTEKLPKLLKERPQLRAEINTLFVVKVTGETSSCWTLNLKSEPPAITQEEASDPDCHVTLSDADFAELAADPSQAMSMYFGGKLKIQGNPMLATKLQQLLSEL